ncbi:MAG: hypothetical protein ACREI3_09980 [Nitrospirales bacterium]
MGASSEQEGSGQTRHPVRPIALIVLVMLLIIASLYSLSPSGPMRPGDVVFANGKQRVHLADPDQYQQKGYEGYCILEPREQLIVLQDPAHREDRSILARFEEKALVVLPFCPPQAVVIAKLHQVIQKVGLWQELRDDLAGLFGQ